MTNEQIDLIITDNGKRDRRVDRVADNENSLISPATHMAMISGKYLARSQLQGSNHFSNYLRQAYDRRAICQTGP
jgi:hypothetical protein